VYTVKKGLLGSARLSRSSYRLLTLTIGSIQNGGAINAAISFRSLAGELPESRKVTRFCVVLRRVSGRPFVDIQCPKVAPESVVLLPVIGRRLGVGARSFFSAPASLALPVGIFAARGARHAAKEIPVAVVTPNGDKLNREEALEGHNVDSMMPWLTKG
jgi:hypothetical protein